jgi:hypothetical protein
MVVAHRRWLLWHQPSLELGSYASPHTFNAGQRSWFRGTARRTAASSLTARPSASLRIRGLGAARVADRTEPHAERDCSNDELAYVGSVKT